MPVGWSSVLPGWDGLYKDRGATVQSVGSRAGLHHPVQGSGVFPKHFIFSFTKHPSAGWEEKKKRRIKKIKIDAFLQMFYDFNPSLPPLSSYN